MDTKLKTGSYHADLSQVIIDGDSYDITAENDDYIVLFRRGRSVYISQVGSEYSPARMYFCRIVKMQPTFDRTSMIQLEILIESPIRRR